LLDKVDAATLQSIYQNNRQFIDEVEVAVYTPDFRMLYHDAAQNDIVKEDRAMIDRIVSEREKEFYVGEYQAVGLVYTFAGKDYVVTAAAYDGYGYHNLDILRRTLVGLFVVGLSLLFVVGYLLARASLKPMRDVVREAESITASKIDRRLPVANRHDELGELSTAFNDLLDRLEVSFNAQKMFVSNVSHEMRTPLAALTAELDIALQKERSPQQYREAMANALGDAQRMAKLIDGLLNLAKADYRKEDIKMEEIRLDELLLDVREHLLRAHPDYHVELIFAQEIDDEQSITVNGNPYLLSIAFANLMENNCKYSPDRISLVQISSHQGMASVTLTDNGGGLSENDREHLFKLFYRGERKNEADGHGIGMALAQKIVQLHRGQIVVRSELGKGTTFAVELPHL
jgi:signal transduction histidine kinase